MSEQAEYWGVDEKGIPYPLASIEDWFTFADTHHDRLRVGWHAWRTVTGEPVEVSTKFFGTDCSTLGHPQRCMFESATFYDGQVWCITRIETREQAEKTHQIAVEAAWLRWPPLDNNSNPSVYLA